MASIFTWESDTPRVSSPWLASSVEGSPAVLDDGELFDNAIGKKQEFTITRLQAEPQEGPIEYKLHLLLRPRRRFKTLSTGSLVSGSKRAGESADTISEDSSTDNLITPTHSASTQQTRQHRLQQLTTQLLWRLQQSSPHHTSSATNFILPTLPEALPELQPPQQPGKLLHGLEESQGALYEIGVSDDGTLVGLADDELNESLNNLRAMAACLGCTVEVLRKQVVGHCEWLDRSVTIKKAAAIKRGPLYVVEALVKPHLQNETGQQVADDAMPTAQAANLAFNAAEQLRITLTGPTMCGKSTLLGTLTTSTLDSGRGTSRLSMLKHRHEITSGITSSVTQEILGYRDLPSGDVEVINYATENVASWIDIHAASAESRLVFVSDSAGHPRYRRTTVRSLVGWAPHWTLFCMPATDCDDSDNSGISDMDLAAAQLDLCLRLELPLVVVMTKLDQASRTSLKSALSRVLDALKAAGRKPSIFPSAADHLFDSIVDTSLLDRACNLVVPLLNDATGIVPIILTSAVQGTGISNLHALLHELPIPPTPTAPTTTVFHIEDMYSKPAEVSGIIVSGHLQSGRVAVGDEVVLGPFSLQDISDDSDSEEMALRRPLPAASRSFPGALHSRRPSPKAVQHALPGQEWKRFTVTSIRNLRLPSHALLAGQVGTIAIVSSDDASLESRSAALTRVRKGMILTHIPPATTRTFVAEFDRQDLESMAVGNHVVVYISSIRASAKVISARTPDSVEEITLEAPFVFDDDQKSLPQVAGAVTAQHLHVTFSFDSGREFVMLDDKVLVMPGGVPALGNKARKAVAGLDGFVGRIVELVG